MTDAVDILMVGGPANGRLVCMNRKAQSTYAEFPVGGVGMVRYTLAKWQHPLTQKWYWIGTADAVDDASVMFAIDYFLHQPAWDLNR